MLELDLSKLTNRAMARKLESGDAVSLHNCEKNIDNEYVIQEGSKEHVALNKFDLCDGESEEWIFSVGRNEVTGQILAAKDNRFYQNPEYECLWLR